MIINKGRSNANQPSSSQTNTKKQKENDVQKIVSNKGGVSKEVRQLVPIDVDR